MKAFNVITASLLTLGLLTGCQFSPEKPQNDSSVKASDQPLLPTVYDYQLYNAQWQTVSLAQLSQQLQQADVIFIGEFHGNHASHLLQAQLMAKLHKQNPKQVLSMEMFNRDQQATLNEYLDGIIGEQTLIDQAPAWNNYKASYRPTVEYAKQHFIPVIAANASGDIVRCIGTQGNRYLNKLDATEKQWIAQQPFAEIDGYQDKFSGFMNKAKHGADSERMRNTYLAQLTRDNTMAESILNALQSHPNHQVIHLNGSFHSENHLGTVGALKRLNPKLNIKVITPIYIEDLAQAKLNKNRKDDFYYLLNPQPAEYVQSQNRQKALKAMFETSRKKAKACK